MGQGKGKLGWAILDTITELHRSGEKTTARDICGALYGSDYVRLVAVHRALRALEKRGEAIREPHRDGARWTTRIIKQDDDERIADKIALIERVLGKR